MSILNELDNNVLMKNNVLVKARYSLSLIENRVFLLMLYKLQKRRDGLLECSINLSEFKEIIKYKDQSTVGGVLYLLEELRKKPIYFKEPKKNGNGFFWGAYGFINGYIYDDELKTFNIEASEKIYTLLKEYLKLGYTPVNLQVWLSLSNSYSQRFYDLLRLWSGTKTTITYEIEEIKELLMLEKKYDRYNDFKRRVLIPSVNELNKTGFFEINFEENKIGRKVKSVSFTVKDLDKRVYFDDYNENNDNSLDLPEARNVSPSEEFYIPSIQMFSDTTINYIQRDFYGCDFSSKDNKERFLKALNLTLRKDGVVIITNKQYNYFKITLRDLMDKNNKLNISTDDNNINENVEVKDDYVQRLLAKKGWF